MPACMRYKEELLVLSSRIAVHTVKKGQFKKHSPRPAMGDNTMRYLTHFDIEALVLFFSHLALIL